MFERNLHKKVTSSIQSFVRMICQRFNESKERSIKRIKRDYTGTLRVFYIRKKKVTNQMLRFLLSQVLSSLYSKSERLNRVED